MATGKITKRTLDALQAGLVEGFVWDQDLKGFGLRITSGGAISYVVQYRMGGREAKTRRYTIGGHGSPWTPSTAREEAGRLLRLVAQGIDPVESDKQRRREAVDLAFSAYADRFAGSCKGAGWKTLVARIFKLHVKPVLRDKPLPTITRTDIVAVLDRLPNGQAAKSAERICSAAAPLPMGSQSRRHFVEPHGRHGDAACREGSRALA